MSLIVLLLAGGAFLLVLGLPLWRLSPRGGGLEWALAWCALLLSGLSLRARDAWAPMWFVYPVMGTYFSAFLYAGARRYSGGEVGAAYWRVASAVALLRGLLVLTAPLVVTMIGAVALVASATLLGARSIHATRDSRSTGMAERMLVGAMPTLIATTAICEWATIQGTDLQFGYFLWLVNSVFVAGIQVATIFDQYRVELEASLFERSQQLRASQDRLAEQQRLVAVGTLAAGIAHQINNPIGAIAVTAQYGLITRGDGNAEQLRDDALRTILDEARRCGRIVKSVLQFARSESTAKWVEDLGPVVLRACEQARDYVVERGGKLELALIDRVIRVRMSPIDIEQVVVNLVRNGAESRKDGAQVLVETRMVGEEAWILVVDDGAGIDPALRARVLEPFFTTRLGEGGSGLGLSVAHGIVTDHGGAIEIDDRPHGGTVFRVRLPLAKELPATRAA